GAIGAVLCDHGSPNTCTASVLYTPAQDYNGPDAFAFRANDGNGDSSPATVSITIDPVNDAPVRDVSKSPGLNGEDEAAPGPGGAVGTLVSSLVDFAVPGGGLDNVSDP